MALITLIKPDRITLTFSKSYVLELETPNDFEQWVFNVPEDVMLVLQDKGILGNE